MGECKIFWHLHDSIALSGIFFIYDVTERFESESGTAELYFDHAAVHGGLWPDNSLSCILCLQFRPDLFADRTAFLIFQKAKLFPFFLCGSGCSDGGDFFSELFFIHPSDIFDHDPFDGMPVFLPVISFKERGNSLAKMDAASGSDAACWRNRHDMQFSFSDSGIEFI